ncbi:HEPN domain-containing protein [Cyanobium sp. WAJ14-Wanaka]|uniref:HEPN domain-containing protein n=1 Tax=Cyanobium sp. WAJ14-Wanaka TaxID=2823725 RepID=UPI0020CFDE09|nr:HEPN domain-containing protein [Cyanobium sp. WAJ14-Wanaka]MCP9774035.1 HEPN domain-containing protein [Cyanobium sp. WAJ14-Wanaka]
MASFEAQAMLRVAWRDLRTARLLSVDEADESSWGFHIQQAIEKAFKAWILSLDLRPPFTHDIAELLQILRQQGVDISPYLQLSRFTLFAVQFRYDDEIEPLDLNRQIWLETAQSLLDEVSSFMGRQA